MKRLSYIFLGIVSFPLLSQASNQKANYVVPTPANLVAHSRFEVEILKPYAGAASHEISYLFPKQLTGTPPLQVNFKRTSFDTETGVTTWDAPEMSASCTDDGKLVQCNIYLKKISEVQQQSIGRFLQIPAVGSQVRVTKPILDFTKAEDFLMNSGFSPDVLEDKLSVLDKFKSSEPAGILSYEYK